MTMKMNYQILSNGHNKNFSQELELGVHKLLNHLCWISNPTCIIKSLSKNKKKNNNKNFRKKSLWIFLKKKKH